MTNQDLGSSNKPSSMNSANASIVDPSKVDGVLEFFSASHGKWIAVEIIDRGPDGSVQVCAKPGKWLSPADCKRKLRARVYGDDPNIGSTIMPADAFLQAQASETPKAESSPKAPSIPRRSYGILADNGRATDVEVSNSSSRAPGVQQPCEKDTVQQPLTLPLKPPLSSGARQVESLKKSQSRTVAPQVDSIAAEESNAGYPRNACSTSTSADVQAPWLHTPTPTPDAASMQSAACTQTPCCENEKDDAPSRRLTSYSCPHCGAMDLPSFEMAVQHCSPEQAENSDQTPTQINDTPKSASITDLPPGFESGRQRNGLRFVRGSVAAATSVPVAISKEPEDSDKVDHSPVSGASALTSVPLNKTGQPRRAEVISVEEVTDDEKDVQPTPVPVEGMWSYDVGGEDKTTGGETDSTRSSENQRTTVPAQVIPAPATDRLAGEAIAYNIRGEPIIARSVSHDTGVGVTIVLNEDGTKCTFGQNTLASLMSSDEADAQTWVSSLTIIETRGLVHEIGQVLLSTSAVYQFHLDRLNQLSEKSHYSFFGLSEDATDKEIDNAYKKLAKQMHPDKNGGTEEAKEQFQQMKDRYEVLKRRRANGEEPQRRKDSDGEKGDADGDTEGEPKRKEAYDEDEDEAPKKKESGQISYDPTDQDSLATTALEMLQRLKAIEGSMTTVKDRLRQQGL